MHDSGLLGVWKSDARRTRRDLRATRDISLKAQRAIGGILGKLELGFTRTRCYDTLDGSTSSVPYVVVAKDSSRVATVSHDLLLDEETITHIHFEGSRFWIHVGSGLFREFFKRIEPARRAQQSPAKRRIDTIDLA
jgi:hypothetical protein